MDFMKIQKIILLSILLCLPLLLGAEAPSDASNTSIPGESQEKVKFRDFARQKLTRLYSLRNQLLAFMENKTNASVKFTRDLQREGKMKRFPENETKENNTTNNFENDLNHTKTEVSSEAESASVVSVTADTTNDTSSKANTLEPCNNVTLESISSGNSNETLENLRVTEGSKINDSDPNSTFSSSDFEQMGLLDFWRKYLCDDTVHWFLEFGKRIQPRVSNYVLANVEGFLQYLFPSVHKYESTISSWMMFLAKPSASNAQAFIHKFINGVLFKSMNSEIFPEEQAIAEIASGRDVNVEFVGKSIEAIISDQESPLEDQKPFQLGRINVYTRNGNSGYRPRAGFGYDYQYPEADNRLPSMYHSGGPYFRKSLHDGFYDGYDNGIADKLTSFDDYPGSASKGRRKYLKSIPQFGDLQASGTFHKYKGQHGWGGHYGSGHGHYDKGHYGSGHYDKGHNQGYGTQTHGHGHKHYVDPYVVLAVLAFLTFFALLVFEVLRAFMIIPGRAAPWMPTNFGTSLEIVNSNLEFSEWLLSALEKADAAFSLGTEFVNGNYEKRLNSL